MANPIRFIGMLAIVALWLTLAWPLTVIARERVCIDDGWRFTKGDPADCPVNLVYERGEENEPANRPTIVIKPWVLPSDNEFIKGPGKRFKRPEGNPWAGITYVQPGFDDSPWQSIDLPHDWAISGPFSRAGGGGMGRLPTAGAGWYRKKLDIPNSDSGKRIFLDMDGAMSYAAVWLNGQLVGGWPYGYASWRLDLTPFVHFGGANTLAIRLDNLPDSSRWYPGAGIYRNVWLVKTEPVHIGHWGTCLTTPDISPERAVVNLSVTVDNDFKTNAIVTVASAIFRLDENDHKTGRPVANIAPVNLQIAAGDHALAEGRTIMLNSKLWGPPPAQKPNRYVAVTRLSSNGKVVDEYETRFEFGRRRIVAGANGVATHFAEFLN